MLSEEEKIEIKEILRISPLLLLHKVNDSREILDFCNSILPFSIGIEIEANGSKLPTEKIEKLYLLDNSLYNNEQSFRIPNGYKGLVALELITIQLKVFLENTLSGNHYHIDCSNNMTSVFSAIHSSDILEKLDNWDYQGSYNKRNIKTNEKGNWVNLRTGFKSCEVRIGELAYNYSDIYNRITELCSIMLHIKTTNNISTNLIYDNNFSVVEIKDCLHNIDELIKATSKDRIKAIKEKRNISVKPEKPLNKTERVIKCY